MGEFFAARQRPGVPFEGNTGDQHSAAELEALREQQENLDDVAFRRSVEHQPIGPPAPGRVSARPPAASAPLWSRTLFCNIGAPLTPFSRPPMPTRPTRTSHPDRVYAFLAAQERPQTAYQILDALRSEGVSAPMTVYRALEKLVADGRVHRLESLNAYVACHDPSHAGPAAFAICNDCGVVSEEVDGTLARDVSLVAGRLDFEAERSVIEIRGRCGACRDAADTASTFTAS